MTTAPYGRTSSRKPPGWTLKFVLQGVDDVVLAAEELRYAAQEVGKVSGLVGVEDILDTVFKEFCIGK